MQELLSDPMFAKRFLEASLRLSVIRKTEAIHDDFAHIVESSRQPNRHFHTLAHSASIAGAGDPISLETCLLDRELQKRGFERYGQIVEDITTRAGAHHDIVYLQVDGHLTPRAAAMLSPFIEHNGDGWRLRIPPGGTAEQRRVFDMARSVFGLQEGGTLDPAQGQNEFLSALLAGIEGLKARISPKHILAEIAMIEATIPFLEEDRFSRLGERLRKANQALAVSERLETDETEAILLGAVAMANRDVSGFRESPEKFQADGERLLREFGPATETPDGLARALASWTRLLERLADPAAGKKVFHGYRGFPDDETLDRWNAAAQENLARQCDRRRLPVCRILSGAD